MLVCVFPECPGHEAELAVLIHAEDTAINTADPAPVETPPADGGTAEVPTDGTTSDAGDGTDTPAA